jgi:tetratricopeptide (TPR) repeat protein
LAAAHNNLGVALQARGKADEAIAAWRKALHLRPGLAEAHSSLGVALRAQGKADEAIAACREAIRLRPDDANAHCNLGFALWDRGQFREALIAIRRGHELGSRDPRWPHPSAEWVRQSQRLVELDAKLSAVFRGEVKPGGAAERAELARFCRRYKQRYAASARFYAEAFGEQPKLAGDLRQGYRYDASCAAALAAAGKGKDGDKLDEEERAHLRQQALGWLRADLVLRSKQLQSWWPGTVDQARRALKHWQQDPDLAGLRDEAALAKLPGAERAGWRKLWNDVAALRKQAGDKDQPEPSPEASRQGRES